MVREVYRTPAPDDSLGLYAEPWQPVCRRNWYQAQHSFGLRPLPRPVPGALGDPGIHYHVRWPADSRFPTASISFKLRSQSHLASTKMTHCLWDDTRTVPSDSVRLKVDNRRRCFVLNLGSVIRIVGGHSDEDHWHLDVVRSYHLRNFDLYNRFSEPGIQDSSDYHQRWIDRIDRFSTRKIYGTSEALFARQRPERCFINYAALRYFWLCSSVSPMVPLLSAPPAKLRSMGIANRGPSRGTT
jgi:hypothetical protein